MLYVFIRDDGKIVSEGEYESDDAALAEAQNLASQFQFRIQTAKVIETPNDEAYTHPADIENN